MTAAARLWSLAPLALVLVGPGCGEVTSQTTSVIATPAAVLEPKAPDESEAPASRPEAPAAKPEGPTPRAEAPEITLEVVPFDTYRARVAEAAKSAKYVLVDAWATNCGPCKENFPHLVQMHKRYAGQGLAVMSVSLDDRDDQKAVAEARKFLKEKGATFPNFLIDEEFPNAFEKFDIGPIPAVFLYGPGGKEVKRFTMDDPDNQFTYDQVEQTVADLLAGKPLPNNGKPGEKTKD